MTQVRLGQLERLGSHSVSVDVSDKRTRVETVLTTGTEDQPATVATPGVETLHVGVLSNERGVIVLSESRRR